MDLELRHLRCLVAVAEEGTLTDAAIALGLTQSGVSRALAQLEDRLGVRLVQRTTRSLALTAEGVAFRDEALRAISAVDDAIAAAHGKVRPLRLGYSWAAAGEHTNALLRQWRAAHPDIDLQVLRCEDRTAGLDGGRVDVALVRLVIERPHVVEEPLFTEPRFLAVADDHPLALRKCVALRDLCDDTLVISSSTGTTSLDLWPPHAAPQRVIDLHNVDEWLTAIGSGQGIGVTPASTTNQHARSGITFVPITDAPPVTTYLAHNDTRKHPRHDEFIALARKVVRAGRRQR